MKNYANPNEGDGRRRHQLLSANQKDVLVNGLIVLTLGLGLIGFLLWALG